MTDVGHETVALQTLLASSLIDTTRLVERLGDEAASHLFRRHDRMARDLMEIHEGREIDKRDGFLILFERPINASRYALEYVKGLEEISKDLIARVGVHFGEVRFWVNPPDDVARGAKPYEVEGLAKSTAIRMMELAGNNQVLMTRGSFDLARRAVSEQDNGSMVWLAHGNYQFKDTENPMEVFEVGLKEFSPLVRPSDNEFHWREEHTNAIPGWRASEGLDLPKRPHWKLERKLMDNDFGDVWIARHAKTHDRRIYKFCYHKDGLRALKSEIALFRLLKESLGDRPDINKVLDWDLEESPFFIESEYSGEGSLKDWINNKGGFDSVSMDERLELIIQIAEALAAAHSVGVLHKNLRPETVLVYEREDGHPQAQLIDFGVSFTPARSSDDKQSTSMSGLGISDIISVARMDASRANWLYMAPELGDGQLDTIQADIFALGVILYQMVSGDFHRFLVPGWERDISDPLLRDDIDAMVAVEPSERLCSGRLAAKQLRDLPERRRLSAQSEAETARLREEISELSEMEKKAVGDKEKAERDLDSVRKRMKTMTLITVVLGVLAVAGFFVW